ncbi:hypothetical protein P4B35_16560 [Pontiellaceae bacterium B12227]|nr:hypothetical protein [Pontiellaceae bacterium B12227]
MRDDDKASPSGYTWVKGGTPLTPQLRGAVRHRLRFQPKLGGDDNASPS